MSRGERDCPECGGLMTADRNWVAFWCDECGHSIILALDTDTEGSA